MLWGQGDPVMADQVEGRGDRFPPFCWDTVPRALAAEVKKFNPHITILGYKNLVLHVQGTADPLFRDHPDWFL
jgi:hypothetical protein